MTRPEAGLKSVLARSVDAIFAAASTEVFSDAVSVTLTPPTVIVPALGVPVNVSVCDSPTVVPMLPASRLIAAALAIALPAALLTGE